MSDILRIPRLKVRKQLLFDEIVVEEIKKEVVEPISENEVIEYAIKDFARILEWAKGKQITNFFKRALIVRSGGNTDV